MSKKKLYDLITIGWELGKFFFSNDFKTADDYNEFTNFGNELLKKVALEYGTSGKEYRFMRRLLVAVNEYCDSEWRETHTGIQTSLFKE